MLTCSCFPCAGLIAIVVPVGSCTSYSHPHMSTSIFMLSIFLYCIDYMVLSSFLNIILDLVILIFYVKVSPFYGGFITAILT